MTISIVNRNDILMINLPAQFDFKHQATFRKAYEDNLDKSVKKIVLNFGKTDYLDSASLGMMLVLRDYIENNSHINLSEIKLSNCQEEIKQILTVANFSTLFSVDF